jgi:pyruvate/2-oxoglutarate dehydrogenase complex dihydrolipoamide acyltransferase (E2) component
VGVVDCLSRCGCSQHLVGHASPLLHESHSSLLCCAVQLSVNDFIIRAVATALADIPEANARWDSNAEEVVRVPDVDVSVAVATPAGLVTPIVKKANTKSLAEISAEVKELATRARANRLKPEEFQGGEMPGPVGIATGKWCGAGREVL